MRGQWKQIKQVRMQERSEEAGRVEKKRNDNKINTRREREGQSGRQSEKVRDRKRQRERK